MKTVFIIHAFDISNCNYYIPTPGVFLTEEEANKYCKLHSDSQTSYSFTENFIGKISGPFEKPKFVLAEDVLSRP